MVIGIIVDFLLTFFICFIICRMIYFAERPNFKTILKAILIGCIEIVIGMLFIFGIYSIYESVKDYYLWTNLILDPYIRPDHGRHLWTEGPGKVRPGYGLYDRAMGIMYMLGVWDYLEKFDKK